RAGKKPNQHTVPIGHVKHCSLELGVHGFAAEVSFWNDPNIADELRAWFVEDDLIEVDLTLEPLFVERSAAKVRVRGLAAERTVHETPNAQQGGPMLRVYQLRFVDAAALLWRQHQPLELRTDGGDSPSTVEALLATHAAEGIHVDVTLDDAKSARPQLCL